jgi:hypothetical protein
MACWVATYIVVPGVGGIYCRLTNKKKKLIKNEQSNFRRD